MKMGQHFPAVLALSALVLMCSVSGQAASSTVSDVEKKGTSRLVDTLQPEVQAGLLGSGRKSSGDSYLFFEDLGLKGTKRVFEVNREGGRGSVTFDSLLSSKVGFSQKDESAAAGILGTLSEHGLQYVKDVLVGEILAEVIPLKISDINARVNSPVGRLDAAATNIVLSAADVYYSDIDLGESGVTIYAAGVRATLEMHWEYHYTASYVPFPVGDGGRAEVEVSGMQVGVSLSLAEHNGTLGLVVQEAGAYIEDLDIVLHGGASWLYQWFVYAFDYNIRSAVEGAITQEVVDGAAKLNNWLLNLPRAFQIDETSAIDVTVVQDPVLNPTYLSVGAKGKFISMDAPKEYPEPGTLLPPGLFCDQSVKMVTIALSDYVLNSAAFVYYDSGELTWDVDTLPGKKYLNTASWKYIIPQLYKKYPNEDMVISFAVSSAPTVKIGKDGIRATAGADMTIEVKHEEDIVPVACINLMVSFDAVASLNYANISGQAALDELTLALEWSEIGSFPVYLVQATVRTIVKEVVLPLINLNLKRGFPLPVMAGVEIENADLRYEDGYLLVCTDVHYAGGFIKELKQ